MPSSVGGTPGPAGPAGPTGPEGPQGPIGLTGPQGVKGDTGNTGPQGVKGDTGNTGPAGTNGTNGTNGQGVPVAGTAGQYLVKVNGTDYNTQWATFQPQMAMTMFTNIGGAAWTSMPAALTEHHGAVRTRAITDLSMYSQARITCAVAGVAGVAGAELRVQYSDITQATWNYLDASAGPACSIATVNKAAVGTWVNLAAGAKTDVVLRVVGINGNGTASPVLGTCVVYFR